MATSTARRTTKRKKDATTLLEQDHKTVKKMFRQFEREKDKMKGAEKQALVQEICTQLQLHAQIEEEIFYPALRQALDDQDLLDEAAVEHASAKDLIAQIQGMSMDEPLFDAKVTVLGEYVNHHVEEEEGEMFKKARSRSAGVDLEALGEQIADRKAQAQGGDGMMSAATGGRAGSASRRSSGATAGRSRAAGAAAARR